MVDDDIRVRRIAPGDVVALERFYVDLSASSRARRFDCASRGIGHRQALEFAAADHRGRDGFVAVADDRIIGHVVLEPLGDDTEELAVAVDDSVQHHGVGTLLLAAALASARLRRIRHLVAWVRADNSPMRRLLTASAHARQVTWDGSVARYELTVEPRADRPAA
jgi:GNAT superfamily N-acetyltransferase